MFHKYSLATSGLKKDVSKIFLTRNEANQFMYHLMEEEHLTCVEVYDDKHDKTFIMNNGARFYIQRAF